jgi:putative transposase
VSEKALGWGASLPLLLKERPVTPRRRRYRTDLTDARWRILASLIPAPKPGGRPSPTGGRRSTRAASWSTRRGTGCQPAVRGGCCRTTCHPGRPSTITLRCWRLEGRWGRLVGGFAPANASAKAGGQRPVERSLKPKRADHRKGRPHGYDGTKKPGRPQAPPAGRHVGPAAGCSRHRRQRL